jgi:hypothetical protein
VLTIYKKYVGKEFLVGFMVNLQIHILIINITAITIGTIFYLTHLPLQTWILAIQLALNAKKGITALQLSRDLEVNKNRA